MSTHNKIKLFTAAARLSACSLANAAETAIYYNYPPEGEDWETQLQAIARDTGIQVPKDNKNSG